MMVCVWVCERNIDQKMAAGEASVVRMKVPKTGQCVFEDVGAPMSIGYDQIDMQITPKADGMPISANGRGG